MGRTGICVVGACNMDLISYVPRLPRMGETLHGQRFAMGFGGKGANQAVMAAKLGGRVSMVSCLGRDSFGESTLKNFEKWGVDATHVRFTEHAFSGVAPIAVDAEGNNSIIIVTGANDLLADEDIRAARDAIAGAAVCVCQLEIPLPATLAALRLARENGVFTLFNPAPARPDLPEELYRLSDLFCPNESETELLTGMPTATLEQAEAAARALVSRGAKTVILTLGERGSLVVTAGETRHIPVTPVKARDTTGAGDCFVGSLAFFLAQGKPLHQAVERANRIAAISVQAEGTQTSFPLAADLPPGILDAPAFQEPPPAPAMDPARLAKFIDHTLLKPDATDEAVDRLCDEAVRYGFKSVCVNSGRVARAAERLAGTGVLVCSVIGFPLGAMDSGAKAREAQRAVELGAGELDMVINVGALKSGDLAAVEADIRAVRQAAPPPSVLKAIIETSLLTEDEKLAACRIAKAAGADFVKTSTGFSGGGATVADIALMRRAVGPDMGVKASGGIKDAHAALAMIEAGANRIGAGAGVAIVRGLTGRDAY